MLLLPFVLAAVAYLIFLKPGLPVLTMKSPHVVYKSPSIPETDVHDLAKIKSGLDSSGNKDHQFGETGPGGPSPANPWVAIIIDDFGPALNMKLVQDFLDMPHDVTISIIPGNLKSAEISQAAANRGKEVFIHLPMEPIDSVAMNERDMIFTDMDRDELEIVIDRIAAEIPNAVGVNNHMGSLATCKASLMVELSELFKAQGWIFVDSRTAPGSVASKTMTQAGVPALGRDVFLDFDPDEEIIREQLMKTVTIARFRGWSIGIGHVRLETLAVLSRMLPELEKEGIKFVSAGRLIKSVRSEGIM